MKTSKPFNPSASVQKSTAAGLNAKLPSQLNSRQPPTVAASPPSKTYKKKQSTISKYHNGSKDEKKSPNHSNQSHKKSGNAGPSSNNQRGHISKSGTFANRKITERVFKPKNVLDFGFEFMTAGESTESTSRNNSPSSKKFSSMVIVKSPEKLEPTDLCMHASNLGNSKVADDHLNQTENEQKVSNFSTIILDENSNNNNLCEDNEEDNCSGYQSTDFQTAYENQSNYNQLCGGETNKNGDCISENQAGEAYSQFHPEKLNKMMVNAESSGDAHSMNCSRRGSFSITTASEMMKHDSCNEMDSTIIDSEATSVLNDQNSVTDANANTAQMQPANSQSNTAQMSKFKINATPFFFPKDKMAGAQQKQNESSTNADQKDTKEQIKQEAQQSKGALASSLMNSGLDSLTLDNEFTPSTPYVHKFRTELCKTYMMHGYCKFGDECSFAHGKTHMMVKTDVSVLYKTKLCKKFSANGYCPYGVRCQFIHDISETNHAAVQQIQKAKMSQLPKPQVMPPLKLNELPQNAPISSQRQIQNNKEDSTAESTPQDKTLLVVNVQPFVPSVKVLAETQIDSAKEVTPQKEQIPDKIEQKKSVLNPESTAFVPTLPVAQQQQFVPVQNAVNTVRTMPMPLGGIGNKQTSVALASEKTVYTDVLVHCVRMSIQEYQKKLKMYNKKIRDNKKKFLDIVETPTIQYMNIYSHGNVSRLNCFKRITECSAAFLNGKEDDDNQSGYFYGDATSYEKHLDAQILRYEKAIKSGHFQPKNFNKTFQTTNEIENNNYCQRLQQIGNQLNNNNILNYLSYEGVGTQYTAMGAPQPIMTGSFPQQQHLNAQNEFYF